MDKMLDYITWKYGGPWSPRWHENSLQAWSHLTSQLACRIVTVYLHIVEEKLWDMGWELSAKHLPSRCKALSPITGKTQQQQIETRWLRESWAQNQQLAGPRFKTWSLPNPAPELVIVVYDFNSSTNKTDLFVCLFVCSDHWEYMCTHLDCTHFKK